MRFTVATFGTDGDTRPLVAVCKGLMQAGHEVQFFAERSTVPFALTHGIPTRALAGDFRGIFTRSDPERQLGKAFIAVQRDNTHSWMKDLAHDCVTSDAVLCSGLMCMSAHRWICHSFTWDYNPSHPRASSAHPCCHWVACQDGPM